MSDTIEATVQNTLQNIVSACRANAPAIASAFNDFLERAYRVEIGRSIPWQGGAPPKELRCSGLSIALEIEQYGMLCLVPTSPQIPEWVEHADESSADRRNRLAGELAKQLVPPDLIGGQHVGEAVGDLTEEIRASNPTIQTTLIELMLFPLREAGQQAAIDGVPATDGASSGSPVEETIAGQPDLDAVAQSQPAIEDAGPAIVAYLVFPVLNPPLPAMPLWPEDDVDSPIEPHVQRAAPRILRQRARRLRNLPVTITVRLAEKRIPLGQLLSIAHGGLITFNKSCEDLLDLYVNNHLFAQGEAVKIGEKFGLKINQIGAVPQRESRIR